MAEQPQPTPQPPPPPPPPPAPPREPAPPPARREPQPPAEADPNETMWAVSNLPNAQVAFYEKDPAHPGGQAWVAASAPAIDGDPLVYTPSEIAKTPAAMTALYERRIKEGEAPPK